MPASRAGMTIFSRTDSVGSRLKDWKIIPICFCLNWAKSNRLSCFRSMPETFNVPEVGRSNPAIRERRVLLPEPLFPFNTRNSPAPTSRLILSMALTGCRPRKNVRDSSFDVTIGSLFNFP